MGTKKLFIGLGVGILLLTGCSKELPVPEPKGYHSEEVKEDMVFTDVEGTLEKPVPAGDRIYLSGDLKKNTYETDQGEFASEVVRVMRGEASKNRIKDEEKLPNRPKKGQEWVMVEVMVWNLGKEDGTLVFYPDEIGLYTKDGTRLELQDVGFDTDYKRVAVYEGKPEKITLTAIVDKDQKGILVGFDKLEDEFDIEDGERVEEEVEEEPSKDETEENKPPEPRFLGLENAIVLETLDPEEAEIKQAEYEEYRKEREKIYKDFEIIDEESNTDEVENQKNRKGKRQ